MSVCRDRRLLLLRGAVDGQWIARETAIVGLSRHFPTPGPNCRRYSVRVGFFYTRGTVHESSDVLLLRP